MELNTNGMIRLNAKDYEQNRWIVMFEMISELARNRSKMLLTELTV
jgi:hypothetical protein